MRREDKIPLLGTDPPWSPEVLLDGRHAQPDVHLKVKLLSRVRLLATLWTAAYQAPPSMGFSRQEYMV